MDKDIGELFESPNERFIEWRISDFFSLKSEGDTVYTSPVFLFADSAWKIELYPDGRTRRKTETDMSLYLRRVDCCSSGTVRMSCRFGIKNAGRNYFIAESDHYKFGKFRWGARNRLNRSHLRREKAQLFPSDVVTFTCTLESDAEHFMKVSWSNRLWNLSQSLKDILNPAKGTDGVLKLKDGEIPAHRTILESRSAVLSRSFKQILDAERETDVIFKLKDGEIPAHRMILESRSAVFNRMFNAGMQEAESGVVNVPDGDEAVFRVVLNFVYSGEPEGLSTENMLEVYKVAHKYELQDLRQFCVDFMKKNLATDRICDIFALAHLYQEKNLKELALDYFVDNKDDIFKCEAWKICKMNNPQIVIELMECALNVPMITYFISKFYNH